MKYGFFVFIQTRSLRVHKTYIFMENKEKVKKYVCKIDFLKSILHLNFSVKTSALVFNVLNE